MDLQKIISELMKVGLTQGEIAKCMDVEQPTVSRYASGEIKSCSYVSGASLLELHRERVGGRRARAA